MALRGELAGGGVIRLAAAYKSAVNSATLIPAARKREWRALPTQPGALPSDGNLDLANRNGEWHVVRGARFQAGQTRLANVLQRFGFGSSLRDATRDRRAFGNDHPGFIGFQRDQQLRVSILFAIERHLY